MNGVIVFMNINSITKIYLEGSMRKIFVLLTAMLLLSGCAGVVALLGSSIGGASNGKIIQSSLIQP